LFTVSQTNILRYNPKKNTAGGIPAAASLICRTEVAQFC
jgi:hypothetical protein